MLRHPCFLAALALAGTAPAQTLAFRRYDVAEGLPSSRVNFVFPDSRGYVWLGTWEGLARFDGAEFTCYGTADGLPNFLVNAVAEDPDGGIWVATQGGGVARLVDRPEGTGPGAAPGSRAKFEAFRLGSSRESTIVLGLRFDPHGHLWCGTEAGVFRGTRGADGQLRFEPVEGSSGATWPQFALPSGTWLADAAGIFRAEGSRVASRLPPPAPGLGAPISLLERPGGGALAVFGSSAFELALPAGDDGAPTWKRLSLELAPNQEMRCAFYDSKGTLWIGTTSGLLRWRDGVETAYTTENGLPDNSIRALCEDRDGDLWMGTWSSGAVKLTGEAIVSYPLPADFPDRAVIRVVLAADGSIYGTTKGGIARLRDDRIEFVPGSREPEFHAIGLRFQQDRRGDFWIGSARGLLRAPGPDLDLRRAQRFGKEDGIPDGEVFGAIYEDRSGRIHVAMVQGDWYIWDPRTSSEPRFERRALERTADFDIPREFFEDSRGQLWLAPYVGLSRVVGDRLEKIEPSDGLPDVLPRFLFEDASSRLWVGTRFAGVSVTDDPAAEKPVFRNWSTRTGLASDAVWSIAQDAEGRVYFGTSRGMEQLDPATGRVRHVTTLDGLAGDIVNHLVRDRSGAIWAGTSGGFSRYDPRAEAPPPGPPPIYLSEIRIAGDLLPIPETGAVAGPDVTLPASRDNLVIAFVGLSFRTEREIAYEHRLEGVDESWSTPSPRRSVEYAHLAPGTYRFLVRARNADGLASSQPASFAFRILPPVWRRPWFLALAAAGLAATAYAFHRARVRRILALEGIRTQIATDIHDDLGSGLAQIAILTEVAKRGAPEPSLSTLDEVAKLARSMRDSMSDIVWAVDPRRDRFSDLVQRMRQAAFNLLEAEGLRVEFRAPESAEIEGIGLPPDKRRHLLLVLKESLANVARHARATKVVVDVRLEPGTLRLAVQDDGIGFDPGLDHRGNGLASLRRRAQALAGTIEIRSAPGQGTAIDVRVPLA